MPACNANLTSYYLFLPQRVLVIWVPCSSRREFPQEDHVTERARSRDSCRSWYNFRQSSVFLLLLFLTHNACPSVRLYTPFHSLLWPSNGMIILKMAEAVEGQFFTGTAQESATTTYCEQFASEASHKTGAKEGMTWHLKKNITNTHLSHLLR